MDGEITVASKAACVCRVQTDTCIPKLMAAAFIEIRTPSDICHMVLSPVRKDFKWRISHPMTSIVFNLHAARLWSRESELHWMREISGHTLRWRRRWRPPSCNASCWLPAPQCPERKRKYILSRDQSGVMSLINFFHWFGHRLTPQARFM